MVVNLRLSSEGEPMRGFLACLLGVALAGCSANGGELIGTVAAKTDKNGKVAAVYMQKSTGNRKMDARVMAFMRTIFSAAVPEPIPSHVYVCGIRGSKDAEGGDVSVLWGSAKSDAAGRSQRSQ